MLRLLLPLCTPRSRWASAPSPLLRALLPLTAAWTRRVVLTPPSATCAAQNVISAVSELSPAALCGDTQGFCSDGFSGFPGTKAALARGKVWGVRSCLFSVPGDRGGSRPLHPKTTHHRPYKCPLPESPASWSVFSLSSGFTPSGPPNPDLIRSGCPLRPFQGEPLAALSCCGLICPVPPPHTHTHPSDLRPEPSIHPAPLPLCPWVVLTLGSQ